MHSVGKDWREKNKINMFDPKPYNIQNYSTETHQKEMKHAFGEELLCNLHLLSDPLKKNLADSIVMGEEKKQKINKDKTFLNSEPTIMNQPMINESHGSPTFGGITSFFSNVLSVISGAVAHWRPKSPVQYYDCFDDSGPQGSPLAWHLSNSEVQNKPAQDVHTNSKTDMNNDCKTAAAQCEEKLNKVRLLLSKKPIETPKFKTKRPKKAFIEAGSVEESFEDAFSSDDFISTSDNTYIEYYSPYQIQNENLLQTASPKVKVEKILYEDTDIIKTLPKNVVKCEVVVNEKDAKNKQESTYMEEILEKKVEEINNTQKSCREEIILSCEDKLSKLKALLQEKHKKKTVRAASPDSSPEGNVKSNTKHIKSLKSNDKTKDKHYKNPCRRTEKRKNTRLKRSIQDDLLFAQEIDDNLSSSIDNSPSVNSLDRLSDCTDLHETTPAPFHKNIDYFDEVTGRFRSTSTTESEDSFQIVFSDSPKDTKPRRISDCDSEDSFIVFEDSPDSCYTSNDVFGDSDKSDSEYTDSEADVSDTEDIQVTKLSDSMSRTLSDLTDGSLYEDNSMDEVDCAVRSVCDEVPIQEIMDLSENVSEIGSDTKSTGLLLNNNKKMQKSKLPAKSVRFSSDPPKVHVMRVWAFAARQARAGHWERCALDRDRFKRRIADVDMAVSWVLNPRHRARIMFQRFMPWWNAQKRKELSEKKAREEEKARKAEEEKARKEEEEKAKKEEEERNLEKESKHEKNLVNGNDTTNDNCVHVDDVSVSDKSVDIISEEDIVAKGKEQKPKDILSNTPDLFDDDAIKIDNFADKLNDVKPKGFTDQTRVNKKSFLNADSIKTGIVDTHNDFTSKLRSGGLSNT